MLNKRLILIPGKNARGGITNYYNSLEKHFTGKVIYLMRGSRNWPEKEKFIKKIYRIINDYFCFVLTVKSNKISLVQTTTAFYKQSIFRDAIYIIISKIFRKKTIVFFRGWNDNYVYNLDGITRTII